MPASASAQRMVAAVLGRRSGRIAHRWTRQTDRTQAGGASGAGGLFELALRAVEGYAGAGRALR